MELCIAFDFMLLFLLNQIVLMEAPQKSDDYYSARYKSLSMYMYM